MPAFGIACLLTYLLSRSSGRFQILDHPNERSLHSVPTSRAGGLAIWAGGVAGGVVVLVSLGVRSELAWITGAALVVGVVSFIDDRSHIPAKTRFVVHLLASGVLVAGGLGLQSIRLPGVELDLPAGWGLLLAVLFIVWMINLYNFMDGMDGFAGGMAVFGFGTLGLLACIVGDGYFAALCWAIAAAAGGFLVRNFPPARIFMGDSGASVLGFMAAALSLWADRMGLIPLWLSLLAFSPFVVDATVTVLRRALRRERFWEAHRSHYYQRLVQLGWGHRKTVLMEYGLMAGCGLTAIVLLRASHVAQWLGICAWGIIYVLLFSAVRRQESRAR
jgi:UDP-N-acetylmuramyl pentapeptide phosphotransferase/UDP-N-acetylglucosamine-1-phosphate transferase